MKKVTLLKIGSAIMLVAVIIINALANILPINNLTTGDVSQLYPNLFTPAGITFAIWTVIYLSLAFFVIKQFFDKRDFLKRLNVIFIISSLANIAWIFAWHYRQVILSVILMIVILVSLIMIARLITKNKLSSIKDAWIKLPFGVYFGWITIATIANTTAFLVSLDWGGFGLNPVWWMIIVSVLGLVIGLVNNYLYPNIYYLLVLVWAYLGILIRHLSDFEKGGFAGEYKSVVTIIIIILIILVLNIFYKLYSFKKK